jgi:hypothetical protein
MKHLYLTLAGLLFFIFSVNAQEIEWQNTIGGNSADFLRCTIQTSDGGYLLGGYSVSNISNDKTENSLGVGDYWIVKTDSIGNIQWQNTIGGSLEDHITSIQQTMDGGFILGGYSSSGISGDKTENCIGGEDYWIVKIDSIGNLQWQNTIGGSLRDFLFSVNQTADGGFILGGYSESNISGDKTEPSVLFDYWIVKTDSLGNIQWQNTIGGNSQDYLYSVKQTTDGGYILGGFSISDISGDKTENVVGSNLLNDYWVIKTDSIGNIQWQNTIGGYSSDFLYSVDQTTDGGYILGGNSNSGNLGDKTENCKGSDDMWIVKLDAQGLIQWQNTIGGDWIDKVCSIQQTSDNGYIFGGLSQSNFSGDKSEKNIGYFNYFNGDSDYWIVKTDSSGNIQWQNTIGADSIDIINTIQQSDDGGFILGGYSFSNSSGDKVENCLGYSDYWIVKLTDKFNLFSGKVFADINSNGFQDSGEPFLPGQKITEQNTGRFSFSQTNGQYNVSVLAAGSYAVSTSSLLWYSPNPALYNSTFIGINQIDSLNDFAYQPSGSYDDLSVTITPISAFRSGFNATYQINYANKGTTTISPTVLFYLDANLTYQSASLTPSQITPDSLTWNLPALTPFQSGSIIITVNVNTGLSIGTLINSSAHIDPILTDANNSNNTSDWPIFTTGSFDPNDILVNKATLTTTQLSTAPWLEYIIRFQNTGNDTAFTVKILNPIDTNKLDISSIEFLNASHLVNVNWINYQRNMEFKFENILLPDSNTNEPLSHGFVRYRIQPKTTLNFGDTIPNFAAIYFDFNDPIITNTAKTIIVLPTGLANSSQAPSKLLVFPNPAQNKINIANIHLENGKAQLRLTDLYGKLLFETILTTTTTEIPIDKLSAGLYFLQSGEMRATFVKQ